ncbi:hypothetical protein LCGC14_2498200, partial [marine sediment metagenome]
EYLAELHSIKDDGGSTEVKHSKFLSASRIAKRCNESEFFEAARIIFVTQKAERVQ